MEIRTFQERIAETFIERDRARGVDTTFRWFVEEVGELSRAIRDRDRESLEEEFADCLAWLSNLASLLEIDIEKASLAKYGEGCPRCSAMPCACPFTG